MVGTPFTKLYKTYQLDKIGTLEATSCTALLYNKDGINDFPFSSGYNVVASQPDGSTR